jgi:hypothetical protein
MKIEIFLAPICNSKRVILAFILSRLLVTHRRDLVWKIGFVAPYTFIQLGTTANTTQSLF